MLTAHLPSGYLVARAAPQYIPWLLPAALIGAVLSDFDMIFFHLVDNQSTHHHRYWVHIPLFWAVVAVICLPLLAWWDHLATGVMFFVALAVHLLLDSIGGGILWAAPFDDHLYSLVTVPATYGHWVISFVMHWTFLLELLIWGMALFVWYKERTP